MGKKEAKLEKDPRWLFKVLRIWRFFFSELPGLIIAVSVYLAPAAFFLDGSANIAFWLPFLFLYLLWGVGWFVAALRARAGGEKEKLIICATVFPGCLLLSIVMGQIMARWTLVFLLYSLFYAPVVVVFGRYAIRHLLRVTDNEPTLSTWSDRIGMMLLFSMASLPLMVAINGMSPTRFLLVSKTSGIDWLLFYVDIIANSLSFGLCWDMNLHLSRLKTLGALDGAFLWLVRTVVDVLLVAAILNRARTLRTHA